MKGFFAAIPFSEFIRHFRKMTIEEAGEDVMKSMDDIEELKEDGKSFGSLMVRLMNERIAANSEKNRINGSKGGRPRKNFPDTRGGSAKPAGCAAGKRIPPQESTTAAGESADPLLDGGSAASAGRSIPPRVGESANSPEVSETPTTAELYDFAAAARLSEADAREWWELCTERGWKDRYGKPIRNWKKACERYCARRAINRMAKGET